MSEVTMASDRIPLTGLAARIAEQNGGRAPSYRKLYQAALDARFPVERENGRLYVRSADVGAAASACGIELG
jgi:hypothetical protein